MGRTSHRSLPGWALPLRDTGLLLAVSLVLFAGATAVGQKTRPATVRPPSAAPARILHFPKDRSLGTVFIQDANLPREITTFYYWTENGAVDQWEKLGEARGDITVPAGKHVQLMVSREGWRDPTPLAKLAADDLYALGFEGTGMSPEASEEYGFLRATSPGDAIMPHLAHLTGLKSLALQLTEVTGSGLRHIEGLRSLECLLVPRRMNDAGMVHVAKLTGLKRLYFKDNNVTNKGLAKLAALRDLEELELGGKKMDDGGLVHLRGLPKLYYLMVWGDTFTDAGMVHVKEIRSLRIFWPFRMSTIGDEGLAHLASLPNLERLNLYDNGKVTDAGMAHVAKMRSLRQLDIGLTGIGDVGAEHLQRLGNLELLELPDGISRPAMAELLATKPRLRNLRCSGSSNSTYGDEILEQVGKMAEMEKFMMSGTSVTDAGLAHLTRCTRLKDVSLFACPITNQGLAELGKISTLERLYMYRARVTTSGLKQLNGLTRLEWLEVSSVTPDEGLVDLSGLTNLRHLTLGAPHKGPQLRDGDLAFLKSLGQLEWLAAGLSFTDAGMANIAGLTRLERISIGGEEVTDRGLAYLSEMKRLDNLTIRGDFTDKGLLQLEQNPALGVLFLICPKQPKAATVKHLTEHLPQLGFFSYGPDLEKMRPIKGGRGGVGIGAAGTSRRR